MILFELLNHKNLTLEIVLTLAALGDNKIHYCLTQYEFFLAMDQIMYEVI